MWESPAIDVPIEIDKNSVEADKNDIPEVSWPGASLSESWWSLLYGYAERRVEPGHIGKRTYVRHG
jgi:hypothetical protein